MYGTNFFQSNGHFSHFPALWFTSFSHLCLVLWIRFSDPAHKVVLHTDNKFWASVIWIPTQFFGCRWKTILVTRLQFRWRILNLSCLSLEIRPRSWFQDKATKLFKSLITIQIQVKKMFLRLLLYNYKGRVDGGSRFIKHRLGHLCCGWTGLASG